jgi:hypothetical protein
MKTFICGLGIVLFAAALTTAQTNSSDDDAPQVFQKLFAGL